MLYRSLNFCYFSFILFSLTKTNLMTKLPTKKNKDQNSQKKFVKKLLSEPLIAKLTDIAKTVPHRAVLIA